MENNRQDDLDMLTLFGSIKLAIKRIFKSIGNVIRISLRNFITIGIFVVVAVALFVGLYLLGKPYYASELLVTHTRLDNDYCKEMVENLNTYTDSRTQNKDLGEQLKLSVRLAKEVKRIEYKPVNENLAKRFTDSTHVLLPFIVRAEVYDKIVLDSLQTALLNYFEQNTYANRRKAIDILQASQMETRLLGELKEIDSLKQIVAKGIIPRATGQGIIMGEPIDPVGIYKRGMEVYEKLQAVRKRQVLIESFEVTVGFSRSARRASAGKLSYIAVGLLIGYLAGYAFVRGRQA
jgi:hypothetical protein